VGHRPVSRRQVCGRRPLRSQRHRSSTRLRRPAQMHGACTMITVRFVTGHNAISDGIRLFEFGFWATHVEAKMPDGTLLGAHIDGGVQARAADYDQGKFSRELYVEIPAGEFVEERFHDFLRSQVGKPYDVITIAGLVAQRNWQQPDSWICSELI